MPTGAAPAAAAHQATPARAPAAPQTSREETRQSDPFEPAWSLQRAIGNQATGRVIGSLGNTRTRPSRGGGSPLPAALRQEMEARFGSDFSAVRIHTGQEQARLTRAYDATAYTTGSDITFAPGTFNPSTSEGRRLLAHELAHVVQASRSSNAAAPVLVSEERSRDELDAESAARAVLTGGRIPALRAAHAYVLREVAASAPVTGVGMSVSLSGIDFDVPDDVTYKPGRRTPQLLAIVLRRLLDPGSYKDDLVPQVESALEKLPATRRFGGFRDRTPAKGGERVGRINFGLRQSLVLVGLLKDKKLALQLTPAQEDLLVLGFANLNLWVDFLRAVRDSGIELPRWYTKDLFDREMSQQGALLREYADTLRRAQSGDEAAQRDRGVVAELIPALMGPISVLDEIRKDIALASDEKTAAPYAALWRLPKAPKGQQPKVTSPPTNLQNPSVALLMLGYMRTQADLARQAEAYHDARRQLMIQFAAYTDRLFHEGAPAKQGDEEIRDKPATANARAFPSTLAPMVPTSGPLLEAALGTDYRFHMEVQFPSVYEALGRYAFTWERVRVPDDQIGQPVDVEKLQREKVTTGEVATVRFDRATAYAKADIERVAGNMQTELGPAGVGALELTVANSILRYAGTAIRFALELLTMPLDQKLVVFPKPGLYMVRAAMSQVREGDEQVVRVPSVAYYPVLARNPDEMAKAGVQSVLKAQEERKKRIAELKAQIATGKLEASEKTKLEQELADLQARDASLGDRLESQRKAAQEQLDKIKAGGEGVEEDAAKVVADIEKRIALRKKRGVEAGESLTARFVSDLGQSIPLVLEVVDRAAPDEKSSSYRVYVSDITTPKSGTGTGTGKTRDDAIVDAVRSMLESGEGYGRGRVSIALSGGVRTFRIEASLGNLLSESIENVTTVLSVALVVAAPATGGATLAFLVPVGMVGAIPSAYRLYLHVDSGTFELDMQNAMDIVNIAGSVIGLGRLGASSLKWVRVGRGLMIVGFGLDAAGGILMGAQLMQQVEELSKLPPGERSAQLLMLIGQQLLQGGVMLGGSMAEHGQQLKSEQAATSKPVVEPHIPPTEHGAGAGATAPKPTPGASGGDLPVARGAPEVTAKPIEVAAKPGDVAAGTPRDQAIARGETPTSPAASEIEGKSKRTESSAKPEPQTKPTEEGSDPPKSKADAEAVTGEGGKAAPDEQITPAHVDELIGRIESGGETGGFTGTGPGVRVPLRKPAKKKGGGRAHDPARILEVGAGKGTGPEGPTNLGIPPERKLAPVTKTDIRARKPAEAPRASRSRYHLDATQPVPPGLVGQFETVKIDNPRGYTPNIGELGKALKPGGRIIVQGRGRVGPDSPKNRRGFNPDFQRLLDEPAPPGYRKTMDASEGGLAPDKGNTSKDILGGPFYSTEGDRRIHPNARVIFEKVPTEPAGGGPAPIGPSGLPGETGPAAASPGGLPGGRSDAATPVESGRPTEQPSPTTTPTEVPSALEAEGTAAKSSTGADVAPSSGAGAAAKVPSTVEVAGARKQVTALMDTARASGGHLEPGERSQLQGQFRDELAKTSYPKKQKQALAAEFDRLIEPPTSEPARIVANAPETAAPPALLTQIETRPAAQTGGAVIAMTGGPGKGGKGGKGPVLVPPQPTSTTKSATKPKATSNPPPPATSKPTAASPSKAAGEPPTKASAEPSSNVAGEPEPKGTGELETKPATTDEDVDDSQPESTEAELLFDEAEMDELADVNEGKPVDIRLAEAQAGNKFNKQRKASYHADEVQITDRAGKRRRLDNYDPVKGEIVSRKLLVTQQGQIAFIPLLDMIGHFQEFALKYPKGARIDITPKAVKKGIAGKTLQGRYIFEVPVQRWRIPEPVLQEAAARGITIRDTAGTEYH